MSGTEPVGRHEFEAVLQAQRQISDTKFEAIIGQLKDMNRNTTRFIEDNVTQVNSLDMKLDDLRAEMRHGRADDDKLDVRLELLEKKNRPTRTTYARLSAPFSVGSFF